MSNAWISHEGKGASNIVLEFPVWYTKDMWNVTFIWGEYAAIPMAYDGLDDNNRVMIGVGHDTQYELKIDLPNKETLVIDLRELEQNLKANPIHIPAETPSPENRGNGYTSEEADQRGLAIIDFSGTWGQEIDLLIPYMTQEGINKIVSIYLERQLFPGITTSGGVGRVAARLEIALKHMSEDTRKFAESRISAYMNLQTSNKQATTKQLSESNRYLFEGRVAANNYQYGNPFPTQNGDTVTLSLVDELSGLALDTDKITIKVVIGGNDGTTQEIILSNTETEKSIIMKENANHHITIHNPNNQLVDYRFMLTIQNTNR